MRKTTGSYRTYSIPSKTVALVTEFVYGGRPAFGSTAAQVPALGQNTDDDIYYGGRRVIEISGSLI